MEEKQLRKRASRDLTLLTPMIRSHRFFSQAAVARSNIASLHTLTEDEALLKESGKFQQKQAINPDMLLLMI